MYSLKNVIKTAIFCMIVLSIMTINTIAEVYKIAEGPEGGTFVIYAKFISKMASGRNIKLESVTSVGSIDNIRKVEYNDAQFAIAYSGHVYQATKGILRGDSHQYVKVKAVGYLYAAAAQMAVKTDDNIKDVNQFKGLKIGIGNRASGAADTAKLFFWEMGVWDHITPYYDSYQDIINEFILGNVDAFWLFTSFPNPSISHVSKKIKISLFDTYQEFNKRNVFKKYPYYTKCNIPPNTYNNIKKEIKTFQDSAILIAHKDVPDNIVAKLAYLIYSPKGLAMFNKSRFVSDPLIQKNGLKGIVTSLHPGAKTFWKKIGSMD